MKKFIMAAILLVTSNAFASETLRGKFELDNAYYELTYTFDVAPDQAASSQTVRIFDNVQLPESTETLPAYCQFEMTFPSSYTVEIRDSKTHNVVYFKEGMQSLATAAYGGLVAANQCEWKVSTWKEKVSGLLRITDWSFTLKGKSYRYFMDTNLKIEAAGNSENLVLAKSTAPVKASSGLDGEVWLDTQPTADGNYQRTWFPLVLDR